MLVSLVALYFGLKARLDTIIAQNTKLIIMHENPEKTGFGTVGMLEGLDANTRAMNKMVHYLKWFITKTTGEEPPPPMD